MCSSEKIPAPLIHTIPDLLRRHGRGPRTPNLNTAMKPIPVIVSSAPRPFKGCRRQLLAALFTTALSCGCATKPVLHPPGATLRNELGSVSIVAESNVRRIRFQVPDSRADVVAEPQSFELVTPCMAARGIGAGPDPVSGALAIATPIIVMGGAPLWQEARRMVCLFAADSADRVAAARATMDTAVAGVRFEQQLHSRLAAELARKVPAVPQVPSRRDADTLVELMVYEPNLSGREGTNPGLALQVGLRVRLLDARTQRELYYDYLDYYGAKHTLVEWASNDARLFRAELERCLAHLSTEVVAQLFVRHSTEVIDRAALAAVGISRRPPQPLTAPGGSLQYPTFKPARYAQR